MHNEQRPNAAVNLADFDVRCLHRRGFLLGGGALAASALILPSRAYAAGLTDILGNASDNALSKLAEPGAFYNDKAVRIKFGRRSARRKNRRSHKSARRDYAPDQ
jgi:hypothetical protein